MNKYVGQNLMVSLFSSTKNPHTYEHVSMICFCFVFFQIYYLKKMYYSITQIPTGYKKYANLSKSE